MAIKTTRFDAADYLMTTEACAVFLTEALKSGDAAHIANAVGAVARACGMAEIAKKTGLSRKLLRECLSVTGSPELPTILKVLEAAGLKLVARPARKSVRQGRPRRTTTGKRAA